jgi:hypothetical protein
MQAGHQNPESFLQVSSLISFNIAWCWEQQQQ